MSIYRLAQTSAVVTSGNAAADIATPTASGVRPRLMEYGYFNGAATAAVISLRRTTALGTRTTPTALIAEDPNDVALAGVLLVDQAVAFSVEPTEAATKLASCHLPGVIGTGIVWTFPRGITIANQLSLALILDAAGPASSHHTVVADI